MKPIDAYPVSEAYLDLNRQLEEYTALFAAYRANATPMYFAYAGLDALARETLKDSDNTKAKLQAKALEDDTSILAAIIQMTQTFEGHSIRLHRIIRKRKLRRAKRKP